MAVIGRPAGASSDPPEPVPAEGCDSSQDPTHERPQSEGHHCRRQSDDAWLVRVLQALSPDTVRQAGCVGSYATTQHPAQAAPWTWARTRLGSPTMAERLLCRMRAVRHENRLHHGQSIRSAVNHRPESRVREIRTQGSEGRETGNSTGLPYPYQDKAPQRCYATALTRPTLFRGVRSPWMP